MNIRFLMEYYRPIESKSFHLRDLDESFENVHHYYGHTLTSSNVDLHSLTQIQHL